jgi:hypothetical protein
MKKYLCNICNTKFKTEEAKKFHESIPINKLDSGYHGTILKNRNKYFIFLETDKISKKHDSLYKFFQVYLHAIGNPDDGHFLKPSSSRFPSNKIAKDLERKILKRLDSNEFLRVIKFLDKHNPERKYYSEKLENYFE